MNILYVIPARGGSKGIPDKNIKQLNGRPLIYYSLDLALQLDSGDNICVSTDSHKIKNFVEDYGINVPFIRPEKLATDKSSTYDVILHALDYYENDNIFYDLVVLLQPTSPFRKSYHVKEAMNKYSRELDMVVSVKKTKANPYYVLFEENDEGYLVKSKERNFNRRQDCPNVWELNGAIYIMNVKSLRKNPPYLFKKVKKYVMNEEHSVDIDTELDFKFAEFLMSQNSL
jgi:N-acylneuraminate cytidylyltransferase